MIVVLFAILYFVLVTIPNYAPYQIYTKSCRPRNEDDRIKEMHICQTVITKGTREEGQYPNIMEMSPISVSKGPSPDNLSPTRHPSSNG